MMNTVNDNGTFTKRTADGSTVFDTSPGMSRLAFGASLSQFNNAERQQTLSEAGIGALDAQRGVLACHFIP